MPEPAERTGHHGYERYLLERERVVVALHRHWGLVARPIALCVLGLVLAVWVDVVAPPGAQAVATLVWWGWLVLLGWTALQVFMWRREWFIATDKRLVLTQGLFTKNVAMMPLTKVTDLSYVRTLVGRVVGYGEFVLESAGQDQALREVGWIPDPDATYRAICAEIFGSPDDDAPAPPPDGDDDPDGPDEPDPDEPDPDGPGDDGGLDDLWGDEWDPGADGDDARTDDHSRAITVTPATWGDRSWDEGRDPTSDGESLYASEDIERRHHADDTGPIHRYEA